MSVAPSPIMIIFLKWNFSFKNRITFPFPPDSAVGCISSKPAYSPSEDSEKMLGPQLVHTDDAELKC